MTEYVRVFETSSEDEANKYIEKGWNLIDTVKNVDYETGGSRISYNLGFSSKEHANKLLAIIKEYEKYGFKEELLKKIAEETGEKTDDYELGGFRVSDSPLANYMSNYEDIVNNKKVRYYKKEDNRINFEF